MCFTLSVSSPPEEPIRTTVKHLLTLETFQRSAGDEMVQGDIANVYKHMKGGCKEDRSRPFSVVPSDRTGGTGHEVKYRKVPLNMRKHFFLLWRCLRTHTGCPRRLQNIHPWRFSEAIWTWSGATGPRWFCLSRGSLIQMTFRGAFQSQHSVIVISNVNLCSPDCSTQKGGMEPMPNTWHFCYIMWINLFGFFENSHQNYLLLLFQQTQVSCTS